MRTIHLGWKSPVADVFFHVFSLLGLGGVQGALSLAFLRIRGMAHATIPCMLAVIVAGLPFAQLLKNVIPRDRPSNMAWVQPQEAWLAKSFPSGHTATSFGLATMICLCRGKNLKVSEAILWFGLALLVGLSRIYRGVHWPTDVLAGAFAGISAACLLGLSGIHRPEHPIHEWLKTIGRRNQKSAANSST
jgi:undecaprenyl-diphosphatase